MHGSCSSDCDRSERDTEKEVYPIERTIEITNYCPHADMCSYCSTNATSDMETAKFLSFDEVINFLALVEGTERINISGGEPLFHPEIGKIIWACIKYSKDVRVYTNMIQHILYNTDFVKDIKVEANVCMVAGKQSYIPKPTIRVKTHLLKLIHQGKAKNLPEQDIVVSRNFWDISHCDDCDHILLQADGKIVRAPCKKEYDN